MLNDLEWCLTLAALEVESWEVEKLLNSNKSKVWKHGSLFSDHVLKPSETLRWNHSKETWQPNPKRSWKILWYWWDFNPGSLAHVFFLKNKTNYDRMVSTCIYPSCAWLSAWPLRKPRCIDDQVERDLKLAKNERKTIEDIQESSKDPQKNRDHVITNHILSNEPDFLSGLCHGVPNPRPDQRPRNPKRPHVEVILNSVPRRRSIQTRIISDTFWHRSQGNSPTKAHNLYNRNQNCWQAIGPAKFDVQELLLLLPNSDLSWLIAANQLIMAPWLICPASSSTSSEL